VDATWCPSKKSDLVTRTVSSETLILPVRAGVASLESIFTLNGVGAAVWDLIDGRRTMAAIVDQVREAFDVDPAEAERDVSEFLADLCEAGLVERP
jgi:hypothetical protein